MKVSAVSPYVDQPDDVAPDLPASQPASQPASVSSAPESSHGTLDARARHVQPSWGAGHYHCGQTQHHQLRGWGVEVKG